MPNHLSYPDEDRERLTSGLETVLQSIQANKKRKRATPDQNGVGESSRPGSKRESISTTMNGNGAVNNDASGDSFAEAFQNSSHDFSQLTSQLTRHASNSTHGVPEVSNASSTAAAALAGIVPQLTIPQPTDISFVSTASGTEGDRQIDSSFDMGGQDGSQPRHTQGAPYNLAPFTSGGTAAQVQAAREASNGGTIKPPVGSDEWHKVRRDNHKEVERRRRETINEGINELAKIVPGCEKNKGSILQRAVSYITLLKKNEEKNIEKWTMEKIVTDQAISELSRHVDKNKQELDRAWRENKKLKETCKNAGLQVDEEENAGETESGADTS